jgi:hypothetical protein
MDRRQHVRISPQPEPIEQRYASGIMRAAPTMVFPVTTTRHCDAFGRCSRLVWSARSRGPRGDR